jgi:hypothetical protein
MHVANSVYFRLTNAGRVIEGSVRSHGMMRSLGMGCASFVHLWSVSVNAHALMQLFEDEHINDGRVARLYYDAFQIVIANEDQARAKIFAERMNPARVVFEGEDSPHIMKLERLAKCTEDHSLHGTSMKWRERR